MLPAYQDLTYFTELSQVLNISRAAERLGITQPSLSMALRRLEHAMGTQLVVRGKKGIALTQAGQRLAIEANQLLEQWRRIKAQSTNLTTQVRGTYRIGCHPSVALYALKPAFKKLLENFADLNLQITHDLSRKIAESVISSKLDIGLVINPVQHPDLVIRPIAQDFVTFWSAKTKGPLQDTKSGTGVLIYDPDLIQSQTLLKKVNKLRWRFGRTLQSSNLEVIAELTGSGAGVGILPSRVARNQARQQLEALRGAPTFDDELCLVYRVENKGIKAIQAIVEELGKNIL